MSFAPVFTAQSRVLIVGTWPSPKSREQGFYYGHPQNRFWPLMARLFSAPIPVTIAEKTALITENGLALWDTIAECTITGASDASIRDAVPNDIAWLCTQAPIARVLCNGATAYRMYTTYNTAPPAVRLPSTSPANAACNAQALFEAWHAALFEG